MRTPTQLLNLYQSKVASLTTTTVTPDDKIVPWLAASGPYAFTPDSPPGDADLFDYAQSIPEAFQRQYAKSSQLVFGAYDLGQHEIERFWTMALMGKVEQIYLSYGERTPNEFTAPMAAYKMPFFSIHQYVLIQNGSYLFLNPESHPEIAQGRIRVHRGIRAQTVFQTKPLASYDNLVQDLYFDSHAFSFISSALAFAKVHGGTVRPSTQHMLLPVFLSELLRPDLSEATFEQLFDFELDQRSHFSVRESVSQDKFGPNYITFETELSNIRITSTLSDEQEVRIINPDKLDPIALHGCEYYAEG